MRRIYLIWLVCSLTLVWQAKAQTCTAVSMPYIENFDDPIWVSGTGNTNTGDAIDSCWSRNTTTPFFWGTRSGTTPSTSGPNSDHTTGSSKYIYTEASVPATNNQTATFTSPDITLGTATSVDIEFWYHMYGNQITRLLVEVEINGNWTSVDSIVGQQQASSTDPWQKKEIIVAVSGSTIKVRFNSKTVSTGDAFNNDVAIDDFKIAVPSAVDLEANALVSPLSAGCFTGVEPVLVRVKNMGMQTLDFSANAATVGAVTSSAGNLSVTLNSGTLAIGADTVITVGNINLSAPGTYTIQGYVSVVGDGDFTNDTLSTTSLQIKAGISAPYVQDFNTGSTVLTDSWTIEQITGTGNWVLQTSPSPIASAFGGSNIISDFGTGTLWFNSWNFNNTISRSHHTLCRFNRNS